MVLDEFAVLGDAITTYGEQAQEAMLLEEMSELQKEICKHWRGKDNVAEIPLTELNWIPDSDEFDEMSFADAYISE